MQIYLMRVKPESECPANREFWFHPYDKNHGLVVRARTEAEARYYASHQCGEEGEEIWMDSARTRCDVLPLYDTVGVILVDRLEG